MNDARIISQIKAGKKELFDTLIKNTMIASIVIVIAM